MDIQYNQDTKSFSVSQKSFSSSWDKFKDVAKIAGISAVMSIIPAVIKIIARKYGNRVKDQLLTERNERLNTLMDNYRKSGITPVVNDAIAERYAKEIHSLIEDSIRLANMTRKDPDEHDITITVNQDQYGDTKSVSKTRKGGTSLMDTTIAPFLVVLKMILIRGVHVLAGTNLGADRRDFELVFEPNESNSDKVARDPFRMVIFKYKWPSHGFDVKTIGQKEANELISATVDFLAHNPKYLAIRL